MPGDSADRHLLSMDVGGMRAPGLRRTLRTFIRQRLIIPGPREVCPESATARPEWFDGTTLTCGVDTHLRGDLFRVFDVAGGKEASSL